MNSFSKPQMRLCAFLCFHWRLAGLTSLLLLPNVLELFAFLTGVFGFPGVPGIDLTAFLSDSVDINDCMDSWARLNSASRSLRPRFAFGELVGLDMLDD